MKYVMPPDKALYKKYEGYLPNNAIMKMYGDYNTIREKLSDDSTHEKPIIEPYNESIHGSYPVIQERIIGLLHDEIIKIKLDEIKIWRYRQE